MATPSIRCAASASSRRLASCRDKRVSDDAQSRRPRRFRRRLVSRVRRQQNSKRRSKRGATRTLIIIARRKRKILGRNASIASRVLEAEQTRWAKRARDEIKAFAKIGNRGRRSAAPAMPRSRWGELAGASAASYILQVAALHGSRQAGRLKKSGTEAATSNQTPGIEDTRKWYANLGNAG